MVNKFLNIKLFFSIIMNKYKRFLQVYYICIYIYIWKEMFVINELMIST